MEPPTPQCQVRDPPAHAPLPARGAPGGFAGRRLHFVDGLRGVAATLVMLYHLVGRTGAAGLTRLGFLGVAIFFVLSGFVIAGVIGSRRIDAGFLGRFALRRMVRLDIPYWASIALALALAAIAATLGVPKTPATVAQVAAHLVYLQTILGYPQISPVYWTLCLEVQFYLALILILWCAQRVGARASVFAVAYVALLALSIAANLEWLHTPAGFMFRYWWSFALGALCCWTMTGRLARGYLYASCGLLLLSAPGFHGDWRVTSTVTAVLLDLAWRRDAMDRWLSGRLAQWLGRISYSLYLLHPLVGWSAQSLALRYLNAWGALLVGLAASLLSAWLAWRWLERPAVRLSHRVRLAAPT